jgi:S1-C subfamily serine protease
MEGPHEVAAGLIVDEDGWAITKASLIGSRKQWPCRLFYTRDGKMIVKGRVVATSAEHDLALMKLDVRDWPVAHWADRRPTVGTFVSTVLGRTAGPLQFAIVGAEAYPELARPNDIPQVPVSVKSNAAGAPVVEESGWRSAEFDAYRERLEAGDVITHLNGIPTPTSAEYGRVRDRLLYISGANGVGVDDTRRAPGSFVGDWVSFGIRRGSVDSTVWIPKIHSANVGGLDWHSNPLSLRRESFPTVFAHDFSLRPEQCGGPVVDLSGNVVGLNIARADATRTLAIPADVLRPMIKALRTQAGDTAK